MNLHSRTTELRNAGRKVLVPYLTAGFPDENTFAELLAATARAGCDVVEVGIPFSDPVADGPVIQATGAAALLGGMTTIRAIDIAGSHAIKTGCSVVIMSYLNPLLHMGTDVFATRAAAAGLAGAILPDLPFEEAAPTRRILAEHQLDLVDLVAPTSGDDRIAAIAASARGFLYLVSLAGVTGSTLDTAGGVLDFVHKVKRHTETPCYVGFGVSEPEQAAALGQVADGVIVGSALLRKIQAAGNAKTAIAETERYLTEMNAALNGAGGKDDR